ncbi:GCD complex subunit gcd7 [Tilletia horrida]|uniref:Translation initiation factor eIF2B subunit beta n=1 Tax=Tilletia horrida TaxID=155126 RepID=A0AAN6JQA4_9BASI|nr:GCD complex subunit gcd7 [Tilletia horrida]KAK0564877.1 GCD complex subunit gcd7 [Tilletia horrida]
MAISTAAEVELKRVVPSRSARNAVQSFALRLRRQQDPSLKSARSLATTTALVMRSIVNAHSSSSSSSIEDLVHALQVAGEYLHNAARSEPTIRSTVSRIITILREEAVSAVQNAAPASATLSPSLTVGGGIGIGGDIQLRATPAGSAPGTGASTPHHHFLHHQQQQHSSSSSSSLPQQQQHHHHPLQHSTTTQSHHHPTRPGLNTMPSAFGSFSISDLVSVGSSQGTVTPFSKLAMSSVHSESGANSLEGSGILTPDRTSGLSKTISFLTIEEASKKGKTEASDIAEDEEEEEDEDESDHGEEEEGEGEEEEAEEEDGGEDDEGEHGQLGIKPLLIQAIQEYIDEIDSVPSSIAKDARDHIHSGETILTLGRSRTIEAFLKAAAAKDRHFTVIVPEGAPDYDGHHLARSLALLLPASNPVLLISDSAVQPLMPRISKVLLSAHSILPNGGILTFARGAALASLAATETRTPVVVLAGVFKVCPDWSALLVDGRAAAAGGDKAGPSSLSLPTSLDTAGGGGAGSGGASRRASRALHDSGLLSPPPGLISANVPSLSGSQELLRNSTSNTTTTGATANHPSARTTLVSAAGTKNSKPYSVNPLSPASLWPSSSSSYSSSQHQQHQLGTGHAEAYAPEWEYVDPARIDVLITNVGEHPPSYVYRLVKENYHAE